MEDWAREEDDIWMQQLMNAVEAQMQTTAADMQQHQQQLQQQHQELDEDQQLQQLMDVVEASLQEGAVMHVRGGGGVGIQEAVGFNDPTAQPIDVSMHGDDQPLLPAPQSPRPGTSRAGLEDVNNDDFEHFDNHNEERERIDGVKDEEYVRDNYLDIFRPERHYTLETTHNETIPKYALTSVTYNLQFQGLERIGIEDLPQAVLQILECILRDITRGMDGQDEIRFYLNADVLDNGVSTAFKPVSELTAKMILDEIMAIHNSKKEFHLLSVGFTLQILHVRKPLKGGIFGKNIRKRTTLDTGDFLAKKQCTVTIKNNDNLCLARAICVSIAHYEHIHDKANRELQARYKSLCFSDRNPQRLAAQKLHADANVPLKKCGLEELKMFQRFIGTMGYRLVVFSAAINYNVIYAEPNNLQKHLFLLWRGEHFDPVTKPGALFDSRGFCINCLVPIREDRHTCKNGCRCCRKADCQDFVEAMCQEGKTTPKLQCNVCKRYFYGTLCLDQHRKNNTCNQLFRCKDCGQVRQAYNKHECNKIRCKYCNKHHAFDEYCYIQKLKPNNANANSGAHHGSNGEPSAKRQKKEIKLPAYFFYDIEAMQETGEHVPNLLICEDEHGNQKLFNRRNGVCPIEQFCKWVFKDNCDLSDSEQPKIFLAHYGRGYDTLFVLKWLHRPEHQIRPDMINTGSKIMALKVPSLNIAFLDSHCFLPMPLASLPGAFKLVELAKGHFPHKFNTSANQNYEGALPALEYYEPDVKKPGDRKKLMDWYAQESERFSHDPSLKYNLYNEMVKYCQSDVRILREACMAFRTEALKMFNIDPFQNSVTIASYCMQVYRTNFMPEHTIGIIPGNGGYRSSAKYSNKALRWLSWLEFSEKITIRHARSTGGEKQEFINGRKYFYDGYDEKTGTIYEFLGCFFHGCPKCYDGHTLNTKTNTLMGDIYSQTVERLDHVKQAHPTSKVVIKWECEFEAEQRTNIAMKLFCDKLDFKDPLIPKDAFFGGRTAPTCLFYETAEDECIRYVDYVSLYPTVNKYDEMPVGHPIIKISERAEDFIIGKYCGIIKCIVLPPTDLYHPVLPVRSQNKLLFPLCYECASTRNRDPCVHTDKQRMISGTWTTIEVDEAVRQGYKLIAIHEVWHYEKTAKYDPVTKKGGLFAGYVNTLMKVKLESSGWPSNVTTAEEKAKFIADTASHDDVHLHAESVEHNPGRRALSKLMLNSLWGKFGQRENMTKTDYVDEPEKFFGLISDQKTEVLDAVAVNPEMLVVTCKSIDEFIVPSGRTNVVVCAFTTAHARLRLYTLLHRLQKSVLYTDTDSVIFKWKKNEPTPIDDLLGSGLGQLTDEIREQYQSTDIYMCKYVSGGPKNYAYELSNGDQVCKVKGINLNYTTKQVINLNLLKNMVTANPQHKEVIYYNDIKRNRVEATLKNTRAQKTFKITFDKGYVDPNTYVAFPFGYKQG